MSEHHPSLVPPRFAQLTDRPKEDIVLIDWTTTIQQQKNGILDDTVDNLRYSPCNRYTIQYIKPRARFAANKQK